MNGHEYDYWWDACSMWGRAFTPVGGVDNACSTQNGATVDESDRPCDTQSPLGDSVSLERGEVPEHSVHGPDDVSDC